MPVGETLQRRGHAAALRDRVRRALRDDLASGVAGTETLRHEDRGAHDDRHCQRGATDERAPPPAPGPRARHDLARVVARARVTRGLVREHVTEQLVLGVAGHATTPPSAVEVMPRRSAASASWAWDFTLPVEQPRTSAICCSERSS